MSLSHTQTMSVAIGLVLASLSLARAQEPWQPTSVEVGAAAICQPSWQPTFGALPGSDGRIEALEVFDDGNGPALYAAGHFSSIDGVEMNHIGKWDGQRWSALGSGTSDSLYAMAVFDDGSGPALYVGGRFGSAGGVPASRLAKWNGVSWSAVGGGLSGFSAYSLEVFDDGQGPRLYVGGRYTSAGGSPANNIGSWDGSTWTALGSGTNNNVNALAVFDDGSGAAIYAGGAFTAAGGLTANHIAKWNGSNWAPLGSGLTAGSAITNAMTVFDDGSGSALYAAGRFSMAGGQPAEGIARWDGTSWSALGAGVSGGFPPRCLTVFDDGTGPGLLVAGGFTTAGGMAAERIAKWTSAGWSTWSAEITLSYYALAEFDDGSGPSLYGAGLGSTTGVGTYGIARWNGQSMLQLIGPGTGVSSPIEALRVFDDGSGPALYVGGDFALAGGIAAGCIARWSNGTWSFLGSGIDGSNSVVTALAEFDDGSGPALYAGGSFSSAGGVAANHIAKWDGTSWSALGSGVAAAFGNARIQCLAVFDDGAGPALYAGGVFDNAGGSMANGIARWNGSAWSALGTGLRAPAGATLTVEALAVFDDGSGLAIYAGGNFTSAGGATANYLARWNGASWSALPGGPTDAVAALTVFDDGTGPALVAAGEFVNVATLGGERPAVMSSRLWGPFSHGRETWSYGAGDYGLGLVRHIAKWDGSSWSAFGAGMDDFVGALEVFDDGSGPALYAGGRFSTAGGVVANRTAMWNGTSWAPLAGGVDDEVFVLTRFDDGSGPALFAGGAFRVGPGGDSYLAKWGCPTPAPDPGTRTHGASSPGCRGALEIEATSPPRVGNPAFAITCTNAPRHALGALLIGRGLDRSHQVLGSQIWVDPLGSMNVASDWVGMASIPLPIPADITLRDFRFDAQFLWVGPAWPRPCPPSGVSASKALVVTILP